jgi:hypothetical protein
VPLGGQYLDTADEVLFGGRKRDHMGVGVRAGARGSQGEGPTVECAIT